MSDNTKKIIVKVTATSSDGRTSTRTVGSPSVDRAITADTEAPYAVETKRNGVSGGKAVVIGFFATKAAATAHAKEINTTVKAEGAYVTSKGKKAPVVNAHHSAKVIPAKVLVEEVAV